MNIYKFLILCLGIIFFSSCKKDPSLKPTHESNPYFDSVDTLISCSKFDSSLVGNRYVQYRSKEEIYKFVNNPVGRPFGPLAGSVSFHNDTAASYCQGAGMDIISIVNYKLENNDIVLFDHNHEVARFKINDACEEKLYKENSPVWYLSKNNN